MKRSKQVGQRPDDDDLREREDLEWEDDDEADKQSLTGSTGSKRGRVAAPLQWSRVLHVTPSTSSRVSQYSIADDIRDQINLRERHRRSNVPAWEMLFFPKDFAAEKDLDAWKMKQGDLLLTGKVITKLRTQLRQQALAALREEAKSADMSEEQLDSQIKLVQRSYLQAHQRVGHYQRAREVKAETPVPLRRRCRYRHLTLDDKVEAAHRVLMLKEPQKDVARRLRCVPSTISQLISKLRQKPALLSELVGLRDQKEQKHAAAKQVLGDMCKAGEYVDSAEKVAQVLQDRLGLDFNANEVRSIMKLELGMKFKKVKEISLHENSVRNLILRQQWAQRYIHLADRRRRIINIDETWLGMEDFRRMKWQFPGTRNSVAKKLWQPRISLIVAFDNFGESYVALSQSNTNSDVILLFIRDLVSQLNVEDRHWRKKTLIFWDGAAYHSSESTMILLQELQVPMMMSGPHSYDAAPCELWFSLFKRVNINPRKVKTGKSNFEDVAELVVNRVKQLPRHQLILMWHHAMLEAFRYLAYRRL